MSRLLCELLVVKRKASIQNGFWFSLLFEKTSIQNCVFFCSRLLFKTFWCSVVLYSVVLFWCWAKNRCCSEKKTPKENTRTQNHRKLIFWFYSRETVLNREEKRCSSSLFGCSAVQRREQKRRGVLLFREEMDSKKKKESIQPQVPLRLPCYDFTSVTTPTVVHDLAIRTVKTR